MAAGCLAQGSATAFSCTATGLLFCRGWTTQRRALRRRGRPSALGQPELLGIRERFAEEAAAVGWSFGRP